MQPPMLSYCLGYLFLYCRLVMCATKPDSLQPRKKGPALSSSPLVTSSRCFQSNSCGLSRNGSQIRTEKMNSAENPAERLQSAGRADPAHHALLCPCGSRGRGEAEEGELSLGRQPTISLYKVVMKLQDQSPSALQKYLHSNFSSGDFTRKKSSRRNSPGKLQNR